MSQPQDPAGGDRRRPEDADIPDGRGQEPGEHPTVARSGRSRTTAIAFAVALVGAALLYVVIAAGISLPGL